MQVDGGTTVSFFIVSEIVQVTPLSLPAFNGARVHGIIPGQLDAFTTTVAQTPLAVLSRSDSASVMSASRQAAVDAWERAARELPRHVGASPASRAQFAR